MCACAYLECVSCAHLFMLSGPLSKQKFVYLFVMAEIYCCNPRLNIFVIPDVISSNVVIGHSLK